MPDNTKAPAELPRNMLAEVVSLGGGSFKLAPRIAREITGVQAARILGMSRSTLSLHVYEPLGKKLLKWRWLTAKHSKRLFDLDSVMAYREALCDPEIGEAAAVLPQPIRAPGAADRRKTFARRKPA